MVVESNCQSCGRKAHVQFAQFEQIIGVVAVVSREARAGRFCEQCCRKHFRGTMTTSLLLGWWSIGSLIFTPFVIRRNIKELRRTRREFDGADSLPRAPGTGASAAGRDDDASSVSAVRQLPWAAMLGMQDVGVGNKPLTWPVGIGALAVFLALASAFGLCMRLDGDGDGVAEQTAAVRHVSAAGLAVSLPLLAGCVYWHRRRQTSGGATPDLLAKLFPAPVIYQTGRAHLAAFGFQHDQGYRVAVVVQNLRDAPTALRLDARIGNEEQRSMIFRLEGAEVILASADAPLIPFEQPSVLTWVLTAAATGTGGKRVRPADRQALSNREREARFRAAMALHGHFHSGGQAAPRAGYQFIDRQGEAKSLILPVHTSRVGPPPGTATQGGWTVQSLWRPEEPNGIGFAVRSITRLLPVT